MRSSREKEEEDFTGEATKSLPKTGKKFNFKHQCYVHCFAHGIIYTVLVSVRDGW
jgi:hypothetical protein